MYCKKAITLLLCAALLTGTALTASCGEATSVVNDTTAEVTAEDTTTAEPEELFDFEGYDLKVAKLAQNDIAWVLMSFGVDEENGDILNDTIVKRNRTVTEKYNFTLTETEISGSTITTIRNMVNAGDHEYDVVFDRIGQLYPLISEGIIVNASLLPSMDLTKPCWNQSMNQQLSVGNSVYLLTGDISVADEDSVEVLVYNTSMANDLHIENLYDCVRKGTWTIDKMYSFSKLASRDLNGDTVMDLEDSYLTLANADGVTALLVSCGAVTLQKDNSGIPVLSCNTDVYAKAYEKVAQMFESNISHDYNGVTVESQVSRLEKNQNLFVNCVTSFARRFLREVKTDFGFLPCPKLDEKQETYYASIVNSTCVFSIPASVSDADKVGHILQVIAENSDELAHAYYDICLQSKYTRDEESYEMLKITIDNVIVDIGYMCGSTFGGLHNALVNNIFSGNGSQLSSTIASMTESVNAAIQKNYTDVMNAAD